jgi:hypothetical protein
MAARELASTQAQSSSEEYEKQQDNEQCQAVMEKWGSTNAHKRYATNNSQQPIGFDKSRNGVQPTPRKQSYNWQRCQY